jgi:hypothetical protein
MAMAKMKTRPSRIRIVFMIPSLVVDAARLNSHRRLKFPVMEENSLHPAHAQGTFPWIADHSVLKNATLQVDNVEVIDGQSCS